jgi:hypothetical protein
MNTQAAIIYMIGLSLVMVSSHCGQKMDKNISLAPFSKNMRFFLRYGSGATAFLGFIYFISSFFVFGWWALALLLGAIVFQIPLLKLSLRYEGKLPLICTVYIILANALCIVSLAQS